MGSYNKTTENDDNERQSCAAKGKTMLKTKKKINYKELSAYLMLYGGNLVFFLTLWLMQKYDDIHLDQVLFQLKTPASGAASNIMSSATVRVGVFGTAAAALELFLYRLFSGKLKGRFQKSKRYADYCGKQICLKIGKAIMPVSVGILIASVILFTVQLNVLGYVGVITTDSDFIEDHYVDPNTVKLTFPEQKRNLIYIFLESMETTYADALEENYIPELTALAEENISFSNTESVGGALPFMGTTWTAAAMTSQTSGVIVKVPVVGESYKEEDTFLPGVASIGEILQRAGYEQVLLLGSDANFANRSGYFTENGHYDIVDINELKELGRLPEDYQEWWGVEDEKLFAFAKEELTRLAAENEPFNFTMLTADTHFPDGYKCRLCEDEFEEQYANVLHCSSKQVCAFVSWIQEQPFYENTTIVISGDHLTMDPDFLAGLDTEYQRTTYNCIINSAVEPAQEKMREFGSFDMYPTTLAALGVEISGDHLALGTNLFSGEETLTEKYGFEVLNIEMQKKSDFYRLALLQEEE